MYKDIHYSLACEEIKKKEATRMFPQGNNKHTVVSILGWDYTEYNRSLCTNLYETISKRYWGGEEVGEYKLYDSVYLKQTNF